MSSLLVASESIKSSGSIDWAFIGDAGFIACIASSRTSRSLSSSSSSASVVVVAGAAELNFRLVSRVLPVSLPVV